MTERSTTIFPSVIFPLIELTNLVLFLNSSKFEVERIKKTSKSRCPAPAGTRRISPAHPTPRNSTYLTNSSYRLPNPKCPHILHSSTLILSLEKPSAVKSSPPFSLKSSPPSTVDSSPPSAADSSLPATADSNPPARVTPNQGEIGGKDCSQPSSKPKSALQYWL